MQQLIKTLAEFLPLIAFFVTYRVGDMVTATGVLVIATLCSSLIIWLVTRTLPTMLLVSAVIVTVFGGLTVLSGDSVFIKMKPTLLYMLMGGVLLFGVWRGRGWLQVVMGSALPLPEAAWVVFSRRWALFFLMLALMNEIVWRTLGEAAWVNFKVFGIMPLTFAFLLSQYPFLRRHIVRPPESDTESESDAETATAEADTPPESKR